MIYKSILVFLVSLFSVAYADNQQSSAGGVGLNCTSGNIQCNSGRWIGCSATISSLDQQSYCLQQTGDVGYVQCVVYDANGYVLSQYADQCP